MSKMDLFPVITVVREVILAEDIVEFETLLIILNVHGANV
jgi:hypothetical protein